MDYELYICIFALLLYVLAFLICCTYYITKNNLYYKLEDSDIEILLTR